MSAVQPCPTEGTDPAVIKRELASRGWILLRDEGYTLAGFSALMTRLCGALTFDPARENASAQTQTVDAGNAAVGLHIENGNTPLPPDIVAFYSARSASRGSQTTLCDGAAIYRALSPALRSLFSRPLSVTRYVPQHLWQRYVANVLNMDDPVRVTRRMLRQLIDMIPGQSAVEAEAGGIDYTLTVTPIREDNLARVPAFANAVLGPSYNYPPPVYRLWNGTGLSEALLDELKVLCEQYTGEITWRDGDVAVIDNKRLMHGRRHIVVPLSERRLYIGMGSALRI